MTISDFILDSYVLIHDQKFYDHERRENRHWEVAGNLYLTHLELWKEGSGVIYPNSFQVTW